MAFVAFPKIPRWDKPVFVTEKIDGTNACVVVDDDGNVTAQSRNRIITPDNDNMGFAKWVEAHRDQLVKLGHGHHYGEYWGVGIQRGYGLFERRFSLFNVNRWANNPDRPECCHVVPTLWVGEMRDFDALAVAEQLLYDGSRAAPGYMNPEGFMIYHTAASQYFKHPFDPLPKGK